MKNTYLLITLILLINLPGTTLAAPGNLCQGQKINKTFASGAVWEFCWHTEAQEGLVLSQVYFKAPSGLKRRVLGEASLSQIEAVFDDAATDPGFVTTEFGLGGSNLQTLTTQDCSHGELKAENGRNVLCTRTLDTGYLYKYTRQRQTQAFIINTFSQVGPRNYQLRWAFYENGTIEPSVGLSGTLSAIDESAAHYGWPAMENGVIATGFTDHYLWRLDFDLDETHDNDVIEEIGSVPSDSRLRKYKYTRTLQTETGRSLNPENKVFWRIADGSIKHTNIGHISYELVPTHYDQSRANSLGEEWLAHDVYFSVYTPCERHAADNRVTGCSRNTHQYVSNNQNLVRSDVVLWYKQSNHYLPRSEDSNRITTRWNSFKLLPRDWHSQNPY